MLGSPKRSSVLWQEDILPFSKNNAPRRLFLLQAGEHTFTITWSTSAIALNRWKILEAALPPPPPAQQDPFAWKIPSFTNQVDVKKDFGAKGDGKSDDTEAIQKAISRIEKDKQGGIVFFPEGQYLIKKTLWIRRSQVVLRGVGVRSRILMDVTVRPNHWVGGIMAEGKDCSKTWFLQKDVSVGQDRITLPANHGLKVGDHIELKANDSKELFNGPSKKPRLRHQLDLLVIRSVQGNTIQLHRKVRIPFPIARKARACLYHPLTHVGIEKLSIQGMNNSDLNAIQFLRASQSWFRDLHISQFARFGVHLLYTRDSRVIHSNYQDSRNFGGGGRGYGFEMAYSVDNLLAWTQSFNNRHGIVIQFGSSGNFILGNEIDRSRAAAIDIHGEYDHHNIIQGNWVYRSQRGVLVGGGGNVSHGNDGPNNKVIQNLIGPEVLIGLQVSNETPHTTLEQNRLYLSRGVGIWVNISSHNTQIIKNRVEGKVNFGILAQGNQIKIDGNALFLDPLITQWAIQVEKNSKQYQITNNTLNGNHKIDHPKDPNATVKNNQKLP